MVKPPLEALRELNAHLADAADLAAELPWVLTQGDVDSLRAMARAARIAIINYSPAGQPGAQEATP